MNESYKIRQASQPVGFLIHEATGTNIAIYKPINWFQRVMIKWRFGLKYQKKHEEQIKYWHCQFDYGI